MASKSPTEGHDRRPGLAAANNANGYGKQRTVGFTAAAHSPNAEAQPYPPSPCAASGGLQVARHLLLLCAVRTPLQKVGCGGKHI